VYSIILIFILVIITGLHWHC